MSMKNIRDEYNVPAKRGVRVEFSGSIGNQPIQGKIVGSRYGHILVKFDGDWRTKTLHPTWELKYLTQ